MRNLSIVICCVLLFAGTSLASENVGTLAPENTGTSFAAEKGDKYWGFDYMFLNYEEDGGGEVDVTALRLRMGYYFSPYFAVEGLVGIGVSDDSDEGYFYYNGSLYVVDVELELDYMMGIYLRGEIPANDNIKFYGVAGFSKAEATASALGYSVSDDDTDLSFGIGLEITPNKDFGINIEYMQLMDESDYDISTVSLGCKFYFQLTHVDF